ncbi:DUF5986 family protein [Clostridium botulinum]|uniref:DUF5986 family protein n=1 Tax=Clostridium botulinum TaxID=1491 RepID=UPI0013F03E99|nr:DUF5986 family protein [Clostridium botulinum]MBY6950328.1 hypothetical protein [Clostridium botulinum]MCR1138577.1 DUF5986 family protein [Clostridium botulinum]NEZ80073.1 hypothetical protein [Clostridium botulinum]NFA16768.1 hypothetical protein [Clostridium botulinum]NFA54139.1 hypothetical protein [Clostridium botulinum]
MRGNMLPENLLLKEKIELILKSIRDGKLQYIDHVKKENLPTENGKYHEIWNYIFKNIKKNFSDFPYKCYKIFRGELWSFIVVYNEETNILYVLMKEQRIKQIKSQEDKEYHYAKILNSINNDFNPEQREQISIFPKDDNKEKYIEEDLERMLGDLNGKVKICVNILFSEKQGKVTNISGNVLDYNLDMIKSECWNRYLKADIDEIVDTNDELNIENPPIELGIKKYSNGDNSEKKKEDTKDMVASKEKQKRKLE